MKQVAATPVAFVRAMVLAYEKYGKDPEAALRQAQITPELLCLPNGRITASHVRIGSGLIAALTDRGLIFAAQPVRSCSAEQVVAAELMVAALHLGLGQSDWLICSAATSARSPVRPHSAEPRAVIEAQRLARRSTTPCGFLEFSPDL